jgi:hypothetical protein
VSFALIPITPREAWAIIGACRSQEREGTRSASLADDRRLLIFRFSQRTRIVLAFAAEQFYVALHAAEEVRHAA